MRRSNCELINNPKAKDTNLLIQTCLGEYYSLYDFNLKTSVWRNKVSQPCVLLTWPQIMDHWGRSLLSVIVFLSSLSQGSQTSCRYWGCKNPCVRFSRFILIILIILIIMIFPTIMTFQLHTVICVHRDPKGMFTLMGATGLSAPKSGGHSHGRSPLHSKEHAYKLIDKLNTQHYAWSEKCCLNNGKLHLPGTSVDIIVSSNCTETELICDLKVWWWKCIKNESYVVNYQMNKVSCATWRRADCQAWGRRPPTDVRRADWNFLGGFKRTCVRLRQTRKKSCLLST